MGVTQRRARGPRAATTRTGFSALAPLVEATVERGTSGGDLQAIDAFVTSRAGHRALRDLGYAGPEVDVRDAAERLARFLERRAVAERIDVDLARRAAGAVAERAAAVARVLALSDGAARAELLGKVQAEAPIAAAPDPYRPIAVPVTAMEQRDVALGPALGGVEVRMALAGRPDAPPLLLVHGHASRAEEYEDLAAALAPDLRIGVVDLPGCGYSEKPGVPYSLSYFEQVLGRALEHLGAGRGGPPAMVAGGGLGGNLALRLAYRESQRERPRIAKVAAWSVAGWGKRSPLLALGSRALALAPDSLFFRVAEAQLGQQYSAQWPERQAMIALGMRYRREVFSPFFKAAYCAIAAEQVGTSMRAHAKDVKLPALLLAGELDRGSLDIRAAVEDLARAMGLTPVIVPGSGYAIANERTAELAAHLRRFFLAGGASS